MRYNDRKDFQYDGEIFKRQDAQTALYIFAEWTRRHAAQRHTSRPPTVFEVDRSPGAFDPLWHGPVGGRQKFTRELQMPVIIQRNPPGWPRTRIGIVPVSVIRVTFANLILQEYDYFPMHGDLVYYDGYRFLMNNPVIEPNAYWLQTNVWLGMYSDAVIVPDGDHRPVLDPSTATPAETSPAAVPAGSPPSISPPPWPYPIKEPNV